MSNRGRGRGNGVKPTDRSSSSSSAASSRNSSLTRPTTSTTDQDTDRLLKQLTTKAGVGSTTAVGLATGARPTPKFTPNLNALKRDKDKTDSPTNTLSSSNNNDSASGNRIDARNGNRSQGFRGGGPNQRGGHARGNYVQMEGIFQGNAQIPAGYASSSSASRMSSIKRESSTSSIKSLNTKKLGSTKTTLIGDVDGLKYEIEEEYEPRQIPISERKSVFDVKKEPGTAVKVKEPVPTTSNHVTSFIDLFAQQKLDSSTNSIVKDEPTESIDIPKMPEPIIDPSQLILMQFPDVLPCTRSSSSAKPELASLSDLPDGFLGKLQIFKSGKCRLKLNDDTYLDVDIAQPTSFLQNVMVTEMASTTPTNEMNKLVCLGDIKHKLIVSLDVDHVLHDTRQ